jgi:hypothetical protein
MRPTRPTPRNRRAWQDQRSVGKGAFPELRLQRARSGRATDSANSRVRRTAGYLISTLIAFRSRTEPSLKASRVREVL